MQISAKFITVLSHHEGALANVTNAGQDAVDARSAQDEGDFLRTVKTCGPGTPTLVSSSWEAKASWGRRWQESPFAEESTV